MHEARNLAAIFIFNRNDKPPVALGDNGLLQKFLIAWGADHLIEPVAHARACGADFTPDIL